jgi:hypothetical protein
MSKVELITYDQMLRELFPLPGKPMKPWAAEAWADRAKLEKTGERMAIPDHKDNCGDTCRNVGRCLVYDALTHDCCYTCNDLGDKHGT